MGRMKRRRNSPLFSGTEGLAERLVRTDTIVCQSSHTPPPSAPAPVLSIYACDRYPFIAIYYAITIVENEDKDGDRQGGGDAIAARSRVVDVGASLHECARLI